MIRNEVRRFPKRAAGLVELAQGAGALGVDSGATLIKLAGRASDGEVMLHMAAAAELPAVAHALESTGGAPVGLTGTGAPELARRLRRPAEQLVEFEAWPLGADALLHAADLPRDGPYLLVAVGTGTSALRVEHGRGQRVGGTALGGGTVLGLASALLGTRRFEELVALARQGDRTRVDLRVADIDPLGALPLPPGLNAASFAKLARDGGAPAAPGDLAQALMALVGENVGLICSGLAAAHGALRIVFGGGALRGNALLADLLRAVAAAQGIEAIVLPHGEFTGAVGALERVADPTR